ncbi:MAG: immunoglobulin-like domain-containing protein, partial [Flavobacteriaceae bacterium]
MMKKLLFLIYIIPILVFSQNSIGVDSPISVSVNETFEIPISLNSDGDFIAFQTDISFNSSAFNYQNYNVDNALIPNHVVTVNLIDQGLLRILVYSSSNSNFPEGNLNFLNLQFNTLSEDGNFTFNFTNTVSDSSEFNTESFDIQVNPVPSAQIYVSGGVINQHSNLVSFVNLTNTVPLKAMQFDITVPNNFEINENLIQTTSRLENHSVSFSLVSTNTYRILIYSTNNSTIDIGSGSLFNFNYLTNETQAGSYQPDYELTELVGENNQIVSGVFEIAPIIILDNSLTISNDLNLGDINLNENIIFSVDLTNNDGVAHFINQIESEIFSCNLNLPSEIAVNEIRNIVFNFTPNAIGNISEVIQFYHTGNESISEINITANVISENYFTILPQSIDNTNSNLNIYLKNSLPVKGFQFDFSIPDGFSIDIDNIENSSVLDNFDYQISQIDDLNYRFLYYDTNNHPIQPDFESIISVPLIVENSVSSGYYSVGFSEVSIVGEQNQNISSSNNTIPQFYYSSSESLNSYLKLVNVSSERGVSKKVEIQLINEVNITGIQFDIDIPSVFNIDLSTVSVISRTTGFSYSLSHITGTRYRCLMYSTSNLVVPIGDSAILEFMVFINESAPLGDYEFNISDVILVDSNNQNTSTPPIEVGYFTVIENSITLLGDNPMTIEVGSAFIDPGATAVDVNGNDISSSILISGAVDVNTIGSYIITYYLTDVNGNISSSVSRTVNIIAPETPVITLLGDNPMTIEVGSTFTDPGATASDAGDGDLTSFIVVSGSVDSNTVGTYTLTYDVSDTSGNAADSVTRTVNVVDTT